ncbi:MAG: response regulator [Kofleriaceae bacterium]|nr:response regulator [Kofleriaceae bacterium]
MLCLAGTLSGLMMAVLALAISRAPGWRELRSFALVAMAASAYCFFDIVHVIPVPHRALQLGEGLAVSSCFIYGMAWIRHLAISEGRELRRFERGALGVGAVLVILAFIPDVLIVLPIREVPVAWFGVTYMMGTATPLAIGCVVFILASLLLAAFGGGRRWRDGWHSRLPMLGAIALVMSGVNDTLAFMQIIVMPQLTEATSVVVVGAIGVSYAHRFIDDARRLEALSTKLEYEIVSRTGQMLEAQATAAEHERLAGLGRIAAGVAHEINNPTMVIQQNLDRMRALVADLDAFSPELDDRFERAHAATKRIAEIVRQLLETGRQPPADSESFAIAPVVEKAIRAARATAPDLHVSVSIADSLCARGTARFLEQVLINVLVNAAHAARDALGGGRVRIEGTRTGDCARLSVTDNGSGIPTTIRDRLFEPFATTKPVGQGTGLGLAVSRSLMTRQGGQLFVGKTTAEGTEMVLELAAADAETVPPRPPTPVPAPSEVKRDLRVLVIDDNEDLREVLVLQLDRFFHVDEAPTVDHALAMAAARAPYDVVLCDLMMPAGGAEEWLARCPSIDPRLADRTILVTGGPTNAAALALIQMRHEKVLYKPVDMEDLRPMIERVSRN